MTKEELQTGIEHCVNDLCNGTYTQEQAVEALGKLFNEALNPFVKAKQHLKLFIYRVQQMRDLQAQFFKGDRKVLKKAQQSEHVVDIAINKLSGELGYTPEDIKKQFEQARLL